MIEEYLVFIEKIDDMIANKQNDIEVLKEKAEGLSNGSDGDRVQSSSNQQKMAEAVAKYTDLEKEIERLKESKKLFIERIEKLPRQYYKFMHDRYLKGLTPTEISRQEGRSASWGSSTHARAKIRLSKIMRGDKD